MNEETKQSMPENRIGHCMTSIREFLMIYGGFTDMFDYQHDGLWSYNTISGIWLRHQPPTEIKDTPVCSSICAVGNLVYLFGGACFRYNFRSTNSLIAFDTSNETWKTIFPHTNDYDENTPPPMYGNVLLYHNGSLYVLGGFKETVPLDTMYKFCLKTSEWFLVPQTGVKPFYHLKIFGTVFKNRLYCFEDSLTGTNRFRDVKIFDFSNHTWTTKTTISKNQQYPEDRFDEAFAFSSRSGFMSGGMIPDTNIFHSDIWRIDLETLEWFKLNYTLTTGIYDHRMTVVDDSYLYSFGGDGNYHARLSLLDKFIIQPPALYRRCQETISKYPNLKSNIKSIPAAILDELNLNNND
ncbi:Kelch domain-containing protein 10 [Thelohanellus kitauei]|uniref:Kelch domain-containing protein 10 n=1 Tax=Thelohanellus kitauei TaxID=669202 RepID=A0A0C2M7U3_THEKT|nr:Kelch domain-containing protein 10 [Thelohanellus kitauei]